MKYKGFSVYDDNDFFEAYIQKRSKGKSPNELIEKPIINELIGTVKGKNILDLGCGDGLYGKELLDRGAEYYLGIEGSANMASLAKENLNKHNSDIVQEDIETVVLKKNTQDIILSRLVLHYIQDLEPLFIKAFESLKENGSFVFSIEHPVITSCYDAYHAQPKRGNWIVDNYFNSGERVNKWINKDVIKYHKTLEEYWQLFRSVGFKLQDLRESKPIKSNFEEISNYKRRLRIPLFIMFKLVKK